MDMNPNIIPLFKAWLALDEDEKRDFVKEMLKYNSLSPEEKKKMAKALEKV